MNIGKITASDKTQRCRLHQGSCVTCKRTCPFPYCQHEDCLACSERTECPMCKGDCLKCMERNLCILKKLSP